MHLTLKKIGDATLIAPLAAIPISILFWAILGIPKNMYGEGYYFTYILVSAISVIVSYPSLLVFGTLPMLIRRKTDGLNYGIILAAVTLVSLTISYFDDSSRQHFFWFLALHANSVALTFWYVLTRNKNATKSLQS